MNIVVFGATSAIAVETARSLAKRKPRFFLVARDKAKLEAIAADLRVRGAAEVHCQDFDLDQLDRHEALYEMARRALGALDVVLVAHGVMGPQKESEERFEVALRVFHTNFLSYASLLGSGANLLEEQKSGSLIAISSVAGERGRQSNYVYGTSKAAVSALMQGIRNRLHRSGVHVMTVKPGFVDTPLTATFPKNPLYASPRSVGKGIVRGLDRKKDVIYLPWFWGPILWVIRAIPEFIFKRMSL